MSKTQLNRRDLLKVGAKTMGAIGLASATGVVVKAQQACGLTTEQPEGPFYPIQDQLDKNGDLTFVEGRPLKAKGEVVALRGVIKDESCVPVKGALVEIWQACHSGKYNHPGDPNTAELDPNFQYWGRAITNEKGEYSFKTIKPGAYPAGGDWVRPPHIHMKVHLRGYQELTTQVYFSEESRLNKSDRILASLSKEDQEQVVVEFKKIEGQSFRSGDFDAFLKKI